MTDFQLPLPMFGDERRKYTFYRILNTVTGKSYVGVTVDYKHRQYSHLITLRKNNHHNAKLQNAYNKHGRESFKWDIIESGMYILADAYEREKFWIARFDSYKNGYNMTIGGDAPGATPCLWNGIHFKSVAECAAYFNIEPTLMAWRIRQGHTRDSDVREVKKTVTWNGIEYPSILDCANALGIVPAAVMQRLRYGYTSDADMKGKEKPIVWDGIEYPSVTIAAETLGINRMTLYGRIRKGFASDSDIKVQTAGIPCIWNGVEYKNLSECARAIGVNQRTITRWLAKGDTSDSDLKKD